MLSLEFFIDIILPAAL